MRLSPLAVTALAFSTASLCSLAADENDKTSAQREARLAQIRGRLETLKPTVLNDKKELQASLHGKPSLLYADNARDVTNSSLWVWEQAGQPIGVTAIEWHPSGENQGRWTFEFATLCPDKVRITLPTGNWTTTDTSRLTPIVDAPAVAETRPQRLVQMKKLVERFTAIEQHQNEGRIQLRRLTAPVYTQAENGDSAMFVFANGTNPEIALLISVVQGTNGEKSWGVRAAALSSTELTLLLDDRSVWSEVRFTRPGTRGTYTNGALQTQSDAKPDPNSPD